MARYHGLAALKEDTISLASSGVGVVAGAAVAKWVVGKSNELLPAFTGSKQVAALIPAAVGLLLENQLAPRVPAGMARSLTSSAAVGMVAYSIGALVVSFIEKPAESDFAKALPFTLKGMNDGVYDYSLGANSAEFGPGGVDAYMMNGFGDAPTTTEVLNGAPVDIVPLNGLGGAPVSVSTYAPLNTALTA